MKAKKFCYQCVLIFPHVMMIGWKHVKQYLNVKYSVSKNLDKCNVGFVSKRK